MNDWLNKAKAEENSTFLFELLSTFQHLPVTIEILKKGNCAKTIKQLSKTDNKSMLLSYTLQLSGLPAAAATSTSFCSHLKTPLE